MLDAFHCEINKNGVSIKVGSHRRAIGVGDYKDRNAYVAAVAGMLTEHLGANLAQVTANAAADKTYGAQAIADAHAEVEAIKADMAVLGTKEEAQAIRKAKELEVLRKQAAETAAKIAALAGEPLPTDEGKP